MLKESRPFLWHSSVALLCLCPLCGFQSLDYVHWIVLGWGGGVGCASCGNDATFGFAVGVEGGVGLVWAVKAPEWGVSAYEASWAGVAGVVLAEVGFRAVATGGVSFFPEIGVVSIALAFMALGGRVLDTV